MQERASDLKCAFNPDLPCPQDCELHDFRLEMSERFSTHPVEVSEAIADCPPREKQDKRGRGQAEDSDSLKKYCLHFQNE